MLSVGGNPTEHFFSSKESHSGIHVERLLCVLVVPGNFSGKIHEVTSRFLLSLVLFKIYFTFHAALSTVIGQSSGAASCRTHCSSQVLTSSRHELLLLSLTKVGVNILYLR